MYYLDIKRSRCYDPFQNGARKGRVVEMLVSDKAFGIYFGNAGQGIDPARGDAATDVMSFARSSSASDDCGDVVDAPSGGWLSRTVNAVANRAALTRIARS